MCIARLMPHCVPPRIDAASVLTGTATPPQRSLRRTAECPMTVSAVVSPLTAEAFVIASDTLEYPTGRCLKRAVARWHGYVI
jgi:hypothetical protein